MTCIEEQVAIFAMKEYRNVTQIFQGQVQEYSGRQYIEDEQILGNADKLVYFSKDMMAHLTKTPKLSLDPFLIAKLDLSTINFFDFPKMKKAHNRFTGQF